MTDGTVAMLVFFILLFCTIVGSILEVTLPYTHRRITKKSDMVDRKSTRQNSSHDV